MRETLFLLAKIKNMTASLSAQDQIAAFLADVIPEKILGFKFSPAIQRRIELLVDKKTFSDNKFPY
jgi:hypothetical protein